MDLTRVVDTPQMVIVRGTTPDMSTQHWILAECGHLVAKQLRERQSLEPFPRAALSQDWDAMEAVLRGANALPASERRAEIKRAFAKRTSDETYPISKMKSVLRRIKSSVTHQSQPDQANRKGIQHVPNI